MARAPSLSEFQTSLPDESSCAAFLFERRWPQGFVCPACGEGRAAFLKSRAHTYECLDCGRQPLEGVVEVDQTEIPFRADNSFFDPVKSGKILIAGAVEVIDRGTNQAKPSRGRNERNTWILDLGASASPLSRTTRRLRSRPLCGPT